MGSLADIANASLGVTSSAAAKPSGSFFGIHMPDLGLPELVHGIAGSLTGIEHAALSAVTGDLAPAEAMGKGALSSFVGTGLNALDVGSLGLLHGETNTLRDEWGNILGGSQYTPQTLMEQYNQSGLLTPIVQNVGNVAAGAGVLSKLASLGDVGLAGTAALTASKASDLGFTAEDITSATGAAKDFAAGTKTAFADAGIEHPALQAAGQAAAKAEGLDVSPAAAASRAKLLNVLQDISHPYRSLFSEVLSPLGRAATAQLGAETAAAGEGAALATNAATEAPTFANPALEHPEVPEAPVAPEPALVGAGAPETAGAGTSPAGAPGVAPAGPAGTAPSPMAPDLQRALDEAVAAHSTPEAAAAAAAAAGKAVDLKRAAMLAGTKPEDQVTLYRGQSGSFDPTNPQVGNQWTNDVKEAQQHAGPGGHILETVVPKDVATSAQAAGLQAGDFGTSGLGAHHLPPEWSALAKPTDIAGAAAHEISPAKTVEEALTRPAPEPKPEPNTLGLTKTERGPIEDAITRARNAPIANWAQTAVSHLPSPVIHALSKTDRFYAGRQTGMVLRERIRMQDVNRREIANSDAFAAPKAAGSKFLVGRTLPDGTKITTDMADKLMGDELIARLEHVSAVEDAVVRHATPAAMETMRQTLVRAGERSAQSIPEGWLHDAGGVRTELGNIIDNSIEGIRNAATEKSNILRATSEKGMEHIAESLPGLSPKSQRVMKSVTDDLKTIKRLETSKIPRERIQAAAEMARVRDELQKVSEELAAVHAGSKAASEAFDLTRIPKNASDEYLRSNAPGINKALGLKETATPAEMRTALTPLQRARSTPDVAGLTPAELYRRGVTGGQAAEQIKQAASDAAALETRRVALAKNLDDMKSAMLPSEAVASKLRTGVGVKLDRVAREMNNPAMAQVPHLKPVWDAITALHEEALHNPELAQALTDGHIVKNWQTVLRVAAEQGFDPVHVRSFSAGEVKHLVYDSVQLGKRGRDLGQTIEAGTRKNRMQAATRTRSLSALAAGVDEATNEMHSNAVADFMHRTYAVPVENDALRPGFVGWDAERQFLLTGEKTSMGTTIVKGLGAPQWQVPKEVVATLHAYQKDYGHGIFNSIRNVTQPWKLLMLTLHPTWYVNHILGHVILASKEGVGLRDWVNAWHAFREGGPDLTRNRFMQSFGAGTRSFGSESGAVAGGLRSELTGTNSLIPIPRGIGGLRDVASTEGLPAAANVAMSRLARPATFVDEMTRVATYMHGVRKGMTDAQALNRTYHALIDFTDMSPWEREVVKSVVPFYSFQKGMLKIVARMPLDHPAVTSTLLAIGKVNQDLMNAQYGKLPTYYQSMLNIPGMGLINAKPLNPFQDADTLTSPQGIGGSMNPFVGLILRNALGAPGTAHPQFTRTDQFGKVVPDTSPAQDLAELLAKLPQVKLGEGIAGANLPGITQKPGTAPPSVAGAVGGFGLPTTYTPTDLTALSAKLANPNASTSSKPKSAKAIVKAAMKAAAANA